MQTTERKLELLTKLNPTVVTKSVADDGKWAVDTIGMLLDYISACPSRDYWKKLQLSDARVRQLMHWRRN